MRRMGLSNAELKAYHRALARPHALRISVTLTNLDEDPLESITPVVLSGQVTVDATAEVSRMLQMEFLDPKHSLNIDTRNPTDGALFIDRFIKVYYSIWVDELDRWVTCQVFTGWPQKLSRDGAIVRVEAYGKEKFVQRPTWRTFHRGKDARRVHTLKALLRERGGESRFDFPEDKKRLGSPFNASRTQDMWQRARSLRGNRQLFYPGTGVCTLRRPPKEPVMTFRPGNGGLLLDAPQVDTDADGFRNTAHIKGKKELDPVVAQVGKKHPGSPRRLKRGDVLGVFAVFESNEHFKTRKQMTDRGNRVVNKQSANAVSPSYNIIPVPHLDELDMVKVVTLKGIPIRHRMMKWALPLTTEGAPPMTVNYVRRLAPRRAKIR